MSSPLPPSTASWPELAVQVVSAAAAEDRVRAAAAANRVGLDCCTDQRVRTAAAVHAEKADHVVAFAMARTTDAVVGTVVRAIP